MKSRNFVEITKRKRTDVDIMNKNKYSKWSRDISKIKNK